MFAIVAVIILSAVGILSPTHRGSIETAAVVVVLLLGFVAGLVAARLYSFILLFSYYIEIFTLVVRIDLE